MPDQIVGGNNGVPMSNGNGGTQETGGAQTQGGGSNTGTNTSGAGGSGTSGNIVLTPTPVDWAVKIDETNKALDLILTQPGFVITLDAFIGLFIAAKYGKIFDNLNVSEDVKKEELDKLKNYYKNEGKAGIEKEYNKLKSAYNDSIKTFKEVAPQVVSTIADAFMPPSLTAIPNVGSKMLQLGIRIKAILSAIHLALSVSKKYLELAQEFGLQELDTTKALVNALEPMVQLLQKVEAQIQKLGAVFSKEEADEANKVMKNKLSKLVIKNTQKMIDLADEVVDNVADGESTGDNRKLFKRIAKIYIKNSQSIESGVSAFEMTYDDKVGTLEKDVIESLLAVNDIAGTITAFTSNAGDFAAEYGARSLQRKLKLEQSVIDYITKTMADFNNEDNVIKMKDFVKQEGFKLNK